MLCNFINTDFSNRVYPLLYPGSSTVARKPQTCPSIVNKHLHLINDTIYPRFVAVTSFFLSMFFESVANKIFFEQNGCHPASDAVSPNATNPVAQ